MRSNRVIIGKGKLIVVPDTYGSSSTSSFVFNWNSWDFPSNQRLLIMAVRKTLFNSSVVPINGLTAYTVNPSYGKLNQISFNGVTNYNYMAIYDGLLSAGTAQATTVSSGQLNGTVYFIFIPFLADANNTPASRVFDNSRIVTVSVVAARF